MTPSGLECLSQEDLYLICDDFLTNADAAFPVRVFLRLTSPDLDTWRSTFPPQPVQMDAVISELNESAEAARAACGCCFGVGLIGRNIEKKYNEILAIVADMRQEREARQAFLTAHEEYLAYQKENLRRQAEYVVQWRKINAHLLTYKDHEVQVEVADIRVYDSPSNRRTEFSVRVTALDEGKILWPCNRRIWGYDVHPDLGGSYPTGASLTDSLGNQLPLARFDPSYYSRTKSIHAGDIEHFVIVFSDCPSKKASSVSLKLHSGVFDQDRLISILLPIKVFLRDSEHMGDDISASPESQSLSTHPVHSDIEP